MNLFLTGASGFIGSAILRRVVSEKIATTATCRQDKSILGGIPYVHFDLQHPMDGFRDILKGVDVVIHSAGLAHFKSNDSDDFFAVNTNGTLKLARECALTGVKRFIFISTIGVNGMISVRPFTPDDIPSPTDLNADSKWEAEKGLWELQQEFDMELVIIRPPLVYGPDAPGNFGSLVRLVENGVPLPLGAIRNQRSLVALDNLVDLIIACIDHPDAANQVFLAGDGHDLSTSELLRGVAQAMGKPSRLIPVPASLLMLAATLLGKRAVAQRLLGSLQVDISKARDLLGWEPPITVEEGLRRCFEFQNK